MDARTIAKEAKLSQARLKELLHYDPETGILVWLVSRGGVLAGDRAGHPDRENAGRVLVRVGGDLFLGHRLAFFYMTGRWPVPEVDHEDGDPSNNRWKNLREATHAENLQNIGVRADNSSGYTGVARYKGRWQAGIGFRGKRIHLGHFDTPEAAQAAYVAAKARLHTFQPTVRE
jgi:hypothetical protein